MVLCMLGHRVVRRAITNNDPLEWAKRLPDHGFERRFNELRSIPCCCNEGVARKDSLAHAYLASRQKRVTIDKHSVVFLLRTTGYSGDYERKESGGARPACAMAGGARVNKYRAPKWGQSSSFTIKRLFGVQARAGGVCNLPADALSLLACRTVRLLAGDSSISARMAQRSSVAETTGKRTTSMNPRASRHCRDLNLRVA